MNTKLYSILAALTALATGANAAISVGPDGSGTLTFSSLPPASEWATGVLTGGGATYTDDTTMYAGVQTVDAVNVFDQLATSGTVPPSTFGGGFRYNTAAFYIQSRPTTANTNAASILKATLQNDSGADKLSVIIGYDFGLFNAAAGQLPGYRVYYSFSGLPNSWIPIPELSVTAAGTVGATLNFASPWVNGTVLYLLWADDNADGVTDESYTIDNFSASWGFTPITITQQPTNVTVLQGRSTTLSVAATGSGPITYQWYHDGTPIDSATVNATANTAHLAITNMTSLDGGMYFCALNNPAGPLNSDTATVTYQADTETPVCLFAYMATNDLANATFIAAFSEPIDPLSVSTFDISISAVGGGDSLNITAAEVLNGTNLMMIANSPSSPNVYMFRPNLISDYYTNAIASDSQVIPVDVYLNQVLPLTANWQYNDSGTDLSNTWYQVGYDAAGWKTGTGVFDGKRTGDTNNPTCRTTVPDISTPQTPVNTCIAISNSTYSAQIPTVYFRSSFNFTGNTQQTVLQLEYMADDGAVFYLNGKEIFRYGISAGPVDYNTLANRTQNDSVAYWQTNVVSPGTALQEGNNVIAVELHQVNLTSSDLTFALAIDAVTAVAPPAQPRLSITTSGADVIISWAPAVGRLQSADELASNPAQTVWTDTGLSNGASVPAAGAKKFYRVINP